MSSENVILATDGHIATITLNRPERMNAISGPMLRSFSQALRLFFAPPSVTSHQFNDPLLQSAGLKRAAA